MQLGGVPLVLVKGVLGICLGHLLHVSVPADLGQDGGGGNGGGVGVSLHHQLVRSGDGAAAAVIPVAVHQHQLGGRLQAVNGPLHGQHPAVENVQLVDLLCLCPSHAVAHRLLSNEVKEQVPPPGRHLLGVVEIGQFRPLGENHRCGIHPPGQRPGSRLVHPSQVLNPRLGANLGVPLVKVDSFHVVIHGCPPAVPV